MPTQYNLHPLLKRIIQDFEDSIRKQCTIDPEDDPGYGEVAQKKYIEAKTQLIDLIGEMDQNINSMIYQDYIISPAAKRNRAGKKQNPRHEVQSRADKIRSVALARLKRKKKARVGKHK